MSTNIDGNNNTICRSFKLPTKFSKLKDMPSFKTYALSELLI